MCAYTLNAHTLVGRIQISNILSYAPFSFTYHIIHDMHIDIVVILCFFVTFKDSIKITYNSHNMKKVGIGVIFFSFALCFKA